MIIGIGIDAVETNRFAEWHKKSPPVLKRLFSDTEIAYILSNQGRSAERFAVRFAVREAVYKIINTHIAQCKTVPFLTLARAICVSKSDSGAPLLSIDWQQLHLPQHPPLPMITWHLSLTHTKSLAIACVIAETR